MAFCTPRDGAAPWRPGPARAEARGEGAAPGGLGAQGGRPLASALSALPPGALCCGARCPGPRAEGGIGAAESRARPTEGRPPLLQPRAAEFSLESCVYFFPLSGLRPKGADESPRRSRSTLRGALGRAFNRAPWSETEGDPALWTRELEQGFGGVEAGIMSICVHVRSYASLLCLRYPPAESKAAPAVAPVARGSGGDGEYSTARESTRRAVARPVEKLRELTGSALP